MKDIFDMDLSAELSAATNKEFSDLSETGYKRFRRRGNHATTPRVQTEAVAAPNRPVRATEPSVPAAVARPVPVPAPAVKTEPMVLSTDLELAAGRSLVAPVSGPAERWNALRQITPGLQQTMRDSTPLVSFNRDDPASKAFDQLRTRLLQTLRAKGWSRIAIAAPTQGCGSTFISVNLGLSLARIPGSRTILMDLNLRSPGVADALGVTASYEPREYLGAHIGTADYIVRVKDTLALGLANEPDQDASELLHDPCTGLVLDEMNEDLDPDVILYDLPPILDHDDLAAFLPQIDGVLLVSGGTTTTAAHIEACERVLEGHVPFLGVILNSARP